MKRFSLKNKVAIITGGAGFFGTQICTALVELNCKVILLDINSFNSNKKKSGKGKIEYVYADITDEDQMKEKIRYIQKKYKKIDILINNASIDYKPKKNLENSSFEETTLENWLYEINVGLTGAFICSKLISKWCLFQC